MKILHYSFSCVCSFSYILWKNMIISKVIWECLLLGHVKMIFLKENIFKILVLAQMEIRKWGSAKQTEYSTSSYQQWIRESLHYLVCSFGYFHLLISGLRLFLQDIDSKIIPEWEHQNKFLCICNIQFFWFSSPSININWAWVILAQGNFYRVKLTLLANIP